MGQEHLVRAMVVNLLDRAARPLPEHRVASVPVLQTLIDAGWLAQRDGGYQRTESGRRALERMAHALTEDAHWDP
ncbi:MAG: hypothetical protein GVY13_06070 [Alphaproteobacteria bacterium]|jgi:ribosomal protein S19E (S16A)|nr:hypothetical protein [Alphaproteobacteria bacterium]